MNAIGGPDSQPVLDSVDNLKRTAAEAAKDDVKPGRLGRR